MADTTLLDLVLKRLEAETQPEDEWSALVLAALETPEESEQFLADGNGATQKRSPGRAPTQESPAPQEAPRTAFLRRLTAQGFRGVGPKATLPLAPAQQGLARRLGGLETQRHALLSRAQVSSMRRAPYVRRIRRVTGRVSPPNSRTAT